MRARLTHALILLSLPALVFSQTPDAAKERQARMAALLDETIPAIRDLRLPENRAFAYAQVGRLLWDQDQTRARTIFQLAGAELAGAMDAVMQRRRPGRYFDINGATQFRQQVLTSIGEKDAALAIDILYRTRPPAVTKAMTPPDAHDKRIGSSQNSGQYIAQNEASLENTLYRMAADQDPGKAIAILKAAIAKPLSQGTFEQLNKLAEKDPAAAADAGNDVVRRLLNKSFKIDEQPDYMALSLSNEIVTQFLSTSAPNQGSDEQTNKLRFDGGAVQSLASRMISAYLADKNLRPYLSQDAVQRYAEKFQPAQVEPLKQFVNAQSSSGSAADAAYSKLMQGDTPADQMISEGSKLPTQYRSQVFAAAANRYAEKGNAAAARTVIDENFTDDAREQAMANLDQQLAWKLIYDSKFSEAEAIINTLPANNRLNLLVQLAGRIYAANKTDNRAYALSVLENARAMIGDHPDDQEEMTQLMNVVGGFSQIEPSRAFDVLERLVPQINDLSEAALVLYGFSSTNTVRDGEFVLSQNGGAQLLGINYYMFSTLGNADLDRTVKLIDSFSRPETRVALRLQVLSYGRGGINSLPINGRGKLVFE